ncbi:putative RNA polymerase II subunit B1 CTD phosphatase RPAP2 [Bufo gargarizans]|uniref:putative RNA polymerase II subunit B1 CTD phosphatase RPAP2 n=1 Tax=Bufo gargarizans TaxID=30331 RepID=UPI001CF5299D|nr:putative RNA polymerase II subunit B1 CTD phosphatase RPAP2 [Bufo gargarizans]
MFNMAERRTTGKSRKSPRKSVGKVQFSEATTEDAAKRRAALENAIRKKIETEKRAHQIVERLLENNISEDFLMDCAKFISPSHYKDIVEERSIIKICGYPICKNTLENVPKQKYKISTRTNKVYDITERKCFCSNFCYRASKYYEAQIPQTPVWSREEESLSIIKLLKEGKSGRSGEEVKLTERRLKISEVEKPKHTKESGGSCSASSDEDVPGQAFVSSIIPVPELSPKDAELLQDSGNGTQEEKTPHIEDIDQKLADTTARLSHFNFNDHEKTSDLPRDTSGKLSQEARHRSDEVAQSSEATEVVTEVTRRAVSKSGAEHLRKLLCKAKSHQATPQANVCPVVVKRSMLEVLTQTLNEWKSEDTMKYLFGTDYVVEHEKVATSTEAQDLDEDDLILDNDDVEDSSNSVSTLNECLPFKNEDNVSKPLPNFGKLREETQMLELRVREFFGGHYILPEEEHKETGPKEETSWAPPLPLVDSCSQQQIRRRIVIEKLKKVLPAILIPLKMAYSDISRELHDLVKTFRFTNTNVIRTVPEWSIIAIVLLSVLLPTMPLHKDSEQNPLYTQFVSKLLEELHFQEEDLECLKRSFASHTLSLSSV